MAEFGTPETWNMKVGDFIETELPKEKPQALLDLQEQNRKSRILDALNKIGPGLMDESLDFIRRENFAKAGEVGKPAISKTELTKLAKKFTQKEIAQKKGFSIATVQRLFSRFGLKSAYKPGGYKGAISEARRELEKKLPKIRKLYLTDKLTISEIADELGYSKKQIESVIEALRGQSGSITEPERIKLYEKNKITKEDFEKRGKLNPQKTTQSVIDDVIKDSKNFSFSETAERNDISKTTLNKIRKDYNLKFPYRADSLRKVSDRVTKDANKLLNILNKNPELVTNVEKLYEKAGLNKVQGNSAIQALKTKTILSGNVPRFNLSKNEQKLVDKLTAPRISAETEALKAGVKEADIKSGMLRPRVALQEYFAVGDTKKRGTVFEHSFPRALIPFVKGKKLQQQLMITGERTSPFLNDFKIRFDRLQKNAVEKFLQDGNLTEYNKTINNIRDIVRKTTGGYEIGYIKFDKNKNATPIVKAKPITEGIKQFGAETTQKISGFKNAKYTTNLLKNYIKNPDNPIFNTLKDEVPVEKITPEVIKASEDAAKAYKKAEPFIGNRQKFINFARSNLGNSLVNALFKSPYGRGALITGAVLSPSFLAADEIEEMPKEEAEEGSLLGDIGAGAGLTTGAVLGSKATQADPLKGLRRFGKKGAMNLLKILGTPAGVAAYEAGLIPGLEGGVVDRLKEGDSAEDVFLRSPSTYAGLPLATLGQEFLKTKPALQRLLNLGLSPKVVRMGTPVGVGLMGLTGLYDAAKTFQEEFEEMSPEQQKEYLAEQEQFAEDVNRDEFLMSQGGRIGFADGPKDPSKRTFLKLMGGIASLPFVGKFFKAGKPVVEKLANTPTVMPDWFPNFVEKFMFNSVGKKIDADLMEYKNPDLPGVTVTRSDDGRVFVEGKNEYDQPYEIQYEPPGYEVVDYETGKVAKTTGNFEAVEGRHVAVGPEDYDVEAYYPTDLDEIAAGDIRAMEKYATGKISGTVKDAMGKDTGLKKGEYDLNMAEGRAESAADIARDLDD